MHLPMAFRALTSLTIASQEYSMFLPQDVIRRKRDRDELTPNQIREFINGIVEGTVNQG